VLLQQLGYSSSRSWQLQNWRHSSKPVHSCHLFLHWSEQCHVGGAGSWPGGEHTLTITIAWPASKYFTIHCSIMDVPTVSVQRRFWVYTKIKSGSCNVPNQSVCLWLSSFSHKLMTHFIPRVWNWVILHGIH